MIKTFNSFLFLSHGAIFVEYDLLTNDLHRVFIIIDVKISHVRVLSNFLLLYDGGNTPNVGLELRSRAYCGCRTLKLATTQDYVDGWYRNLITLWDPNIELQIEGLVDPPCSFRTCYYQGLSKLLYFIEASLIFLVLFKVILQLILLYILNEEISDSVRVLALVVIELTVLFCVFLLVLTILPDALALVVLRWVSFILLVAHIFYI